MPKLSPTNAMLKRLTVTPSEDGVTTGITLDGKPIGRIFRCHNWYEVRLVDDTILGTPGGGKTLETALRSAALKLSLYKEVNSAETQTDGA